MSARGAGELGRNARPAPDEPAGGACGRAGGDCAAVALTLRRATQCDLAPLEFFFDTALRRDYFVRRGQLAEILRGARHEVFVAEIDAVLVGVAITTRGARLVNALVHPAYRGLGIGRELVAASGAREVRAKIDMSSGDPRGFYRSLGFASTGERNRKQNIELMARLDSPTARERRSEPGRAEAQSESGGRARRGEPAESRGKRKRGGL